MKSRSVLMVICLAVMMAMLLPFVAVPREASALSGLRIAILGELGADSSTILAVSRMFAAMGHTPMVLSAFDLKYDRLNTNNFDILVIPGGQLNSDNDYASNLSGYEDKIRSFVNSGGGFIGIEAGARYASSSGTWNGGSVNRSLDLYSGTYTGPLNDIGRGMAQIEIDDTSFGSGKYTVYASPGAAYFSVAAGATKVASYETGVSGGSDEQAAIVRFTYGSGRGVLIGPSLELEESTELDWTTWDNLENSFYDVESDWPLVARIVEWVYTGSVQNDTSINPSPLNGKRVAVYAYRNADGGASAKLLPAVARMIEYSGHTPLAIKYTEVNGGKLTRANFDGIVFPGGYAYGYKTQMNGYEANIRNFVSNGGSATAICAGVYYIADSIIWEGRQYTYPVDLYLGVVEGPLEDMNPPYPGYTLTPINITDSTLGGPTTLTTMYYGSPFLHPPTNQTVTFSGFYAYGGKYNNEEAVARFDYGSGKVFLPNLHVEAEEGSTNDWLFWDNYKYDSPDAVQDPESDWPFFSSGLNWSLPSTGSSPFTNNGTTLGVLRTSKDTTGESLGDAQRQDVSGSSPTLVKPSDGWYSVDSKKTMELTGFGFGAGMSGTITGVTLKVKYSVEAGSDANSYVQWSTDGTNYSNTTIQPLNGHVDVVATYDLKAAGVDTWAEIQNLRIKYYNNDALADSTSFDYVWVVVATTP